MPNSLARRQANSASPTADTVVLTIPADGSLRPGPGGCSWSFGHSNHRVLDGGLKKWRAEGRAIETGEVMPKPGDFTATLDSSPCAQQGAADRQPVQTQRRAAYRCARRRSLRGRARAAAGLRSGHIPGSRNLPYNQLFDAATGAMKPLDDLRAAFADAGLDLDEPIVTSCGSACPRRR